MNKIVLTGWKPDFNQYGLTVLLRDKAGMQLHEAKKCTDTIVQVEPDKKRPVTIEIESDELAEHILAEAIKLGALGKLVKSE